MVDVSLQLLCTKKSGTLSRIVREINLLGLQYQNHQIKINGEESLITINASGDLNCTPESFVELFTGFPEVKEVQSLDLTRDGKSVQQYKTIVSETHIDANERLTPAVVLAAEKRMSEILGPVAAFIVESHARECRNAGELFTRLSEELDDQQERDYFLSIIESGR